MDVSPADLASHLSPTGLPWLRDRYRAGGLAWLRASLGDDRYAQLGRLLDDGDTGGAGALLAGAGVLGTSGATAATVEEHERRTRFGWVWLVALVALLAILVVLLARCDDGDGGSPRATSAGSVAELAGRDPAFSTLAGLLESSGLAADLAGDGPFTVFAPTNAAFAAVPMATLDALKANPEALRRVLLHHVVDGEQRATQLRTGTITTLDGGTLDVTVDGGAVEVDGVRVSRPDLLADNGVVHGVDGVLLPAGLDLAGSGSATATTVGTPTTAPTTTVRPATTTTAPTATAPTTTATTTAQGTSLVDVVAGAGNFRTLFDLVARAGLADALRGPGPFTVFGPDDAAFAKLPKATLDALTANPDALGKVLRYHVVAGNLRAADIRPGSIPTLNGEPLTVALDGSTLKVNNAAVTRTDLVGSNGVFHAVDTVLIPANLNLSGGAQQKFTVFFDSGATTPNAASQATLQQATAAIAAARAGTTVVLTGYADTQGDPASNLTLSQQRADTVRATLAATNSALGFVTNAKGDTEGGADLAAARRVEIVIG